MIIIKNKSKNSIDLKLFPKTLILNVIKGVWTAYLTLDINKL